MNELPRVPDTGIPLKNASNISLRSLTPIPPNPPIPVDEAKKTPINDVIKILADNGFYSEAVKVTTPLGTPILPKDSLAYAKKKYYGDVKRMNLATILREPTSDRIPQMTIKQLRKLSDKLYFTKTEQELTYLFDYLNENGDFPEEILEEPIGMMADIYWQSREKRNRPTMLFDKVIPDMIKRTYFQFDDDDDDDFDVEDFNDYIYEWKKENERKFFENVYRVLIKPTKNNPNFHDPYRGGKITRRKRRKTRKSRKNKRNTKRRTR